MNNQKICKWCKSERIEKIDKPISKYKKNIYYFDYCNNCEIKFAYCKSKKVKINYDAIQKNHSGYNMHIADNKWIKSLFDNKERNFSINEMYTFLTTKTMDQRYIRAIEIAYEAYKKNKKLNILEVGCNLGYVGALFIKLKHNYLGIDVQNKAIKEAKKNYGSKYFKKIPFEKLNEKTKKKFDLICSFEVIEHLNNPRELVEFSIKNLKKNGEVVLSTPNGNYLPKDVWYSELPPIHFSLFKEKTFKILRKKNLEVNFYNKYQFGFNIHFLRNLVYFKFIKFKKLLKKNTKQLVPTTDPNNKLFIYTFKNISLQKRRSYNLIRLSSIINLFFSLIFATFNIAPLAGQIFVRIKKKS